MKIDKIDNELKLLEKSFNGLEEINKRVQVSLTPVVRWLSISRGWLYMVFHPNTKLRKQNDLAHSFAMVKLNLNLAFLLEKYNPHLDGLLLVHAAWVHELGEGELKNDVCHLVKTKNHDLDELLAVIKLFSCLRKDLALFHHHAFLLQFVGSRADKSDKAFDHFPEADQIKLNDFWQNKRIESLIFQYSERLEYILYALEQGVSFRNYVIVEEVLRNHLRDMRQACELIPGWQEEIWTPKMDNLAKEIQIYLNKNLPKLYMPQINRGL